MRRALPSLLAATVLASLMGCGLQLGRVKTSNAAAAGKKDCAACEKMCAVAGDAENNPAAVEACKADCRKSCE
jgi:hypothetical protein